ncbi:MAG: hypothetical protein LBG07_01510 [Treponema sp.]|jgi:hypothetical protein|nr:hypothetical protein [Treponema sp.]
MYTPPLSDFSVISLRRLAWAMGITMGKAFGRIVRLMPAMVDSALVCQHCRDNTKCSDCVFKTTVSDSEKAALTAI